MASKNMRSIRQRTKPSAVRVSDALDDYFASVRYKRLATSTKVNYRQFLPPFAIWCATHALVQRRDKTWEAVESDEGICLHQVNDQAVELFLEHIRATSKPSSPHHTEISDWTLATYVKCIRMLLNWCAVDEQYCSCVQPVVIQRIEMPEIKQEIIRTFSRKQLNALFKACEKEESPHLQARDLAIVNLLLETGIRANELVLVCIGDIHLERKDAHVCVPVANAKWGSGGEMPLGKQTRQAIQAYIKDFREPTIRAAFNRLHVRLPTRQYNQELAQAIADAPLFVSRYGEPLTRDGLRQIIKRLGEWAGIEGVRCTPHDFRHTFSVLFMENGGDIFKLQKILRHKSVKTTENYLQNLMPSEARKNVQSVRDTL